MVQRMVCNDLDASQAELGAIIRYLADTYSIQSAAFGREQALSLLRPSSALTPLQTQGRESILEDSARAATALKVNIGLGELSGSGRPKKDYSIQQFKDTQSDGRNNAITFAKSTLVQDVSEEEMEVITGYMSAR